MRFLGPALLFIAVAFGVGPADTPEQGALALPTPEPAERFVFAVLGDRVPGPDGGLEVLAGAVETCNRLGVRFVMTTGNMIRGDTSRASWDSRAATYRLAMSGLDSPWFPTRGPMDAALRGETVAESDRLYAERFGPAMYSFDSEWAHVVVLPAEQLADGGDGRARVTAWLADDLKRTDAEQVFVVLHSPLWRTNTQAWDDVHKALADRGLPTRVISGGTRYAREDRQRDNVRYTSVSMTGAFASGTHGYASRQSVTLINVTRLGHAVTVLAYDAATPGEAYTGSDADAVQSLAETGWASIEGFLQAGPDAGDGAAFEIVLENPTQNRIGYAIETITPSGWVLDRDQISGTLEVGQTLRLPIAADAPPLSENRPKVEVMVTARYPIAGGETQSVVRRLFVPVRPRGAEAAASATPSNNGVLALDGRGAVRVDLGEKPWRFTMECWVRGDAPSGNAALLSRYAEGLGSGLVWSRPRGMLPSGIIGTSRGVARVGLDEPLDWSAWHHIALTFNGSQAVLYVDGKPVGTSPGGDIAHGDWPLFIGAEPNARGDPVSLFAGLIDEVRVSSNVRYTGPFVPSREFATDGETLLLLHFDTPFYGAHPDDSGRGNHAWTTGQARIIREPRD